MYIPSLHLLGTLHYEGEHIKKDLKRARSYFEQCAQQQYPDSLYYLGILFKEGHGVEENTTTAYKYFKQAANLGHKKSKDLIQKKDARSKSTPENAQLSYMLAKQYRYGLEGHEEDETKAIKWYIDSINKGNYKAAKELAEFYHYRTRYTNRNPLDDENAIKWYQYYFENSPEQNADILHTIARICHYSDKEQAIDYYIQAGKLGHKKSIEKLSKKFYNYNTLTSPAEIKQGIEWYSHIAQQNNNTDTVDKVAHLYLRYAKISDRNESNKYYTQAHKWYSKAEKRGSFEARFELAKLYRDGLGCKKDLKIAFNLLTELRKQEFISAYILLGDFFENGYGRTPQYRKARKYYLHAAKKGNNDAMYKVALLYEKEKYGVKKNLKKALYWYEKDIDSRYYLEKDDKSLIAYKRLKSLLNN